MSNVVYAIAKQPVKNMAAAAGRDFGFQTMYRSDESLGGPLGGRILSGESVCNPGNGEVRGIINHSEPYNCNRLIVRDALWS
jgi:hypothetical protein